MIKAILTIGVAALSLSSVDGQATPQATPDRTTEKGESSIKGKFYICPHIVKGGGGVSMNSRLCASHVTLGLANDVNLDAPSFECALTSSTDPNVECQPYLYSPVASSLGSFPGIWNGATIVEGDNNALAKWASIQPSVPDIPPKVDSLLFRHLSLAFSDAVILLRAPFKEISTV